jgi:hypothetical protein
VKYSVRESGAYGTAPVVMNSNPDECVVEEFASGVIRLEGNVGLNFCIAWAANLPARRNLTILGDAMGLSLPKLTLYGTSCGNLADITPTIIPLEKYGEMAFPGHCYLIENALLHLTKGEPLTVRPEETLNVTAALELFYRSCREQKESLMSDLLSSAP